MIDIFFSLIKDPHEFFTSLVRGYILHESEAFICKALKGGSCPAYGGNAEPLIEKAL
jgi:hypothetical protein